MFGPDIARVKINTSTADFARKDFKVRSQTIRPRFHKNRSGTLRMGRKYPEL